MDEPDDLSDEIKKLEERKAHLEDVKASYLRAQAVLPYLQQNIDITDWQIRAYKNLPPEASEIPKPNRKDELKLENQYLRGVYTLLNIPSEPQLHSSTSVTISGGTIDYSYIDRVRDIGTPSAIEYGNSFILEYNQLQDVQQRPRQVRDRLEGIGGEHLLERFDTANNVT